MAAGSRPKDRFPQRFADQDHGGPARPILVSVERPAGYWLEAEHGQRARRHPELGRRTGSPVAGVKLTSSPPSPPGLQRTAAPREVE